MPMGLRACFAAIAAAVVSCSSIARAVDVIPGPEGGPAVTDLKIVNGKYELRDAVTGAMVMQERNALPMVTVMDSRVTYSLRVNEQPSGYDAVVTFTNPTNQPLPIGTIYVGMLTLGADIEYLDVRHSSVWRPANFSTYVGKGYTYPDDLYSPVFMVRGSKYAVGVSLRYPVIEYDHDVRIATMNPSGSNSGEGGPGWGAGFRLSNPANCPPSQLMKHPGALPPHTSRTYVVTVRVSRDTQDWMGTLVPYLKYFRAMYGGVAYTRMTQPILPVGIADSYYQEPGNLDGFGDPNLRRPDLFGWGPWADQLVSIKGYSAVMLWAPSGLYFFNPQYNYPFQITTRWDANPLMAATAYDPAVGLPRVQASGTTLGLWWGRSLDVSTAWDASDVTPLDPDNPEHVRLAERELDGAVRAGVHLVGLDTCNPSINGIRNAYRWVKHLREQFPSITFISEPSPCDVLNTQVGGVLPGWALDGGDPKTLSDCYPFKNPHYLADFLLPGNETVMSFRYNFHEEFFNHSPTDAEVDADVRWFASMGYVPMVWRQVGTVGDVRAARSWEWTVPGKYRTMFDENGDAPDKSGSGDADSTAGDQNNHGGDVGNGRDGDGTRK